MAKCNECICMLVWTAALVRCANKLKVFLETGEVSRGIPPIERANVDFANRLVEVFFAGRPSSERVIQVMDSSASTGRVLRLASDAEAGSPVGAQSRVSKKEL